MLNLLRYSLLLGLGALAVAVTALALLYRELVFDSLIEGEARSNVALTRTFANAIWPEYAGFVTRAGELPPAELAGRREIRNLDFELRRLKAGTSVVKVKIYDTRGVTVYSTDARQIGEDKSGNPGVQRALGGVVASDITYRERFDAWEGTISDRNIIATYVPVRVLEYSPVDAVMEIYSDVTPLVERMQRTMWQILAGVLGALGLVYAAGLWSLLRYHRLLREKEAERAAQEERIRHQAFHDALTGLPNRASFNERLEQALRRARRSGRVLALMFLDLDRFKRVNDTLGHDAGDELLCVTAERVRRCVREADELFRVGGDEFTVILEDVGGREEVTAIAQRVIDSVREPARLGGSLLEASVSIGIALQETADGGAERLVKSADMAMYRAKELGRNRYTFYAPGMDGQMAAEALARRAAGAG